ncbi:MAG: YccF domain-containing protein [Acidimicrobiia bacterium]|nr:YccF domain-containing protein [Acidimicrobiia bacterium]
MGLLRTIGNILWFVLAGIWLAIGYALAGLVMCITIIGIPFGIQSFKLAAFVLWPFGKVVVRSPSGGCLEVGFNILWLLLFGWAIFLGHLIAGVFLCLTIIGIPFGIQLFKISVLALWPFGRTIVPAGTAYEGVVVFSVPADPR